MASNLVLGGGGRGLLRRAFRRVSFRLAGVWRAQWVWTLEGVGEGCQKSCVLVEVERMGHVASHFVFCFGVDSGG